MTAPKPGRNDPCPCGSGKKFKKCCGFAPPAAPDPGFFIPEDQRTGTPFDDYSELFPLLALHEHKIVRFEADGPELEKARKKYEKRYRPGKVGGLLDSHFVSWFYFDLRFGKSRKTVVERVIDDPMTKTLIEPGPTRLRHMAESYATFYQVVDATPAAIRLEELGTGRLRTVHHFCELIDDTPPGKGEIWYTRLIGPPDRSLCYTTPYVYERESRDLFKRGAIGHFEDFLRNPCSIGVQADRKFAESQKYSALFWAEYIRVSNDTAREMLSSVPSEWPTRPAYHIVNTDKEELLFTETYLRVKDEQAVRKRLATLKTFDYDEKDDSWTWLKARSRKFPDAPRTSLGHFRFRDGCLVAETNSRERAARLEDKLRSHLPGLCIEKTIYKRLEDVPPLPPEEREKLRQENTELNARPEVQEALRRQLEHHYFQRWPQEKVPALGNITPRQAAKTEAGRKKLADLIDFYDRTQDASESAQPKIDFDRLRLMMGLPAKRH